MTDNDRAEMIRRWGYGPSGSEQAKAQSKARSPGEARGKAWILELLRRLAEAEAKIVREYERDVPRLGFGQTRGRFPRVRQADDRLGAVHALIDNLIDIDDYGLDDVLAHVEYHRDRGHAQSWEWVHKQIVAHHQIAEPNDD